MTTGFYIGCTSDLKDRVKRHINGQIPATKDRLPVILLCYFAFKDKYRAFSFEKYLKSGSGRAFLKNILSSQVRYIYCHDNGENCERFRYNNR